MNTLTIDRIAELPIKPIDGFRIISWKLWPVTSTITPCEMIYALNRPFFDHNGHPTPPLTDEWAAYEWSQTARGKWSRYCTGRIIGWDAFKNWRQLLEDRRSPEFGSYEAARQSLIRRLQHHITLDRDHLLHAAQELYHAQHDRSAETFDFKV